MRIQSIFHSGKSAIRVVRRNVITAVSLGAISVGTALSSHAQAFTVNNILSDGSVPAQATDTSFINPWGVSASPNWWISAQGSGLNFVLPVTGVTAFKVTVPLAAQPTLSGLPAGSVTTGGAIGFLLPNGAAPSFFFSTLDGTISGWNGKLGTAGAIAQIVVNNSSTGAAYTGLALLNTASASFLLAPNFSAGTVDVYNSTYQPAKLGGAFTDPNLPTGYFPFSIHILGSQIFVTYAQHASTTPPFREFVSPSAGVVDVFDTTGTFVSRVVTGGNLNAPWGVAFAPASFGIYSNDLLIGNFGDGKINVYDPKTFSYIGQVMDVNGKSLVYASLWELLTGGTTVAGTTAVSAGSTSSVYFSAGLTGEAHGLFAAISNSTVAGSTPTFGFTSASSAMTIKAGTAATVGLSVAPVNGFSGTVTLTCSGLPVGVTCNFSPSQYAVSPAAASLGTVTISTTAASAESKPFVLGGGKGLGTSLALLLPFTTLLGMRRKFRQRLTSNGGLMSAACGLVLLGMATLISGCGGYVTPITPTPAGTANVLVSATAGTVTQSTTVAVTVQ